MESSQKKGFSLIELMVVIAIVGILSAIAMPAYKTYVIKARVVEAVTVLDSYKSKVIEIYSSTGSWPSVAGDVFPNPTSGPYAEGSTNYITQFYFYRTGAGVVIAAKLSPTVFPTTTWFWMGIKEEDGIFKFECGKWNPSYIYGVPNEYRPASCQNDDLESFLAS